MVEKNHRTTGLQSPGHHRWFGPMKIMYFADRAKAFFTSRYHALIRKGATFCLLSGLLYLGGCAAQSVQLSGEVSVPAKAGVRKVFVMADAGTPTTPVTDQLAALLQSALREQGFKVVDSEDEADLIILPFFTLLQGQEGFTPNRMPIEFHAQDWNDTGGNLLEGSRGTILPNRPTFIPTSRIGLMVTAIAHENWMAVPPDSTDVPRVWRVTASTTSSVGEEQKYLPELVQAAAPFFGKNTNGTIAVQIKPAH